MTDTVRTRSAILTLFADNITKAISAQDLRDFVVSIMGVFGEMYVSGGTTAQVVTQSPSVLTAWSSSGEADGVTVDTANNKLTVGTNGDGTYKVDCDISYKGDHNAKFKFTLRRTGASLSRSSSVKNFFNTALDGLVCASFHGYVTAVATDTFQVYVETDQSSSNLTVVEAQFSIDRKK